MIRQKTSFSDFSPANTSSVGTRLWYRHMRDPMFLSQPDHSLISISSSEGFRQFGCTGGAGQALITQKRKRTWIRVSLSVHLCENDCICGWLLDAVMVFVIVHVITWSSQFNPSLMNESRIITIFSQSSWLHSNANHSRVFSNSKIGKKNPITATENKKGLDSHPVLWQHSRWWWLLNGKYLRVM